MEQLELSPKTKSRREGRLIRTPLGLCFWDHGANEPVTDGLLVTAYRTVGSSSPIQAVRSPSGIYSFHGLPGLHDWEYPLNDVESESSPPIVLRFIVKVEDLKRRFIDTAAIIQAPRPGDRLFVWPSASPGQADDGFRLFSAPTRPRNSRLATVRANLWEVDRDKAAAFAVLRVEIEGITWTGIADEKGTIAVMFPYPNTMRSLAVSPPSSRIPVHEQSWNFTASVFYGGTDMSYLRGAELPSLGHLLSQTPTGFHQPGSNSLPELSGTLTMGRETVLRTFPQEPRSHSKLLIGP